MDPPAIRYVPTSGGHHLAYSRCGSGRTLVFVPNNVHHIGWAWQLWPEWMEGLAARFRLLQFNFHGQGLSSRGVPPDHTNDVWEQDLATVVDTLAGDRVVLMGTGIAAHIAVRYAAKHPDRVDALIINCGSLTMSAWPESFWQGLPGDNWEVFLEGLMPRGLRSEELSNWTDALRETWTPEDFNVLVRVIRQSSIEAEAGRVEAPTLVLHPRRYAQLRPDEGAQLAAQIPDARFVVIEGDRMYGEARQGLAAIDDFLGLESAASSSLPVARARRAEDPDESLVKNLSSRQIEVLLLIAGGKTNKEIAEELVLSLRTVERHVTDIYDRLGVRNRAEAIAMVLGQQGTSA